MIELADEENRPSIKEIKNHMVKSDRNIFRYIKQNYDLGDHFLTGFDDDELKRVSEQILGVQYEYYESKAGLKNNGVLPIIASLAEYMERGFVDEA
ncbi:MAG: hypothetical protein GWN56_10170 [Nitrosopumilaceae archaeon]|nr:hypothetical protein [Nitrosopumilaceae archaeon]